MRHPTEGTLRRLLDEPVGVSDADRRHVAGCPQCLAGLAAARQDAAVVGAALATDPGPDVDLVVAWHRLSTAGSGSARTARPTRTRTGPARSRRTREFLRRPAVAVTAVAVVLAGAGTAAANDWLPIFRTEQLAPVSITTADLVSLPDLDAYGTLVATADPDVHEVPDAATAAKESGLPVPAVAALPRGITGDPTIQVGGRASATFTFSAERAARAAEAAGRELPPVPPGLDGSQVRLSAGPGVAQVWSSSAGAPAFLVGRAVAPTAESTGVPFGTVRDYLLSLPGLPANVAAQLRTFAGDGSTLPLPIPADRVTSSSAQVQGRPATVLATRDKTLAAVVWVRDGVVTVVAGALDQGEVLSVARELG